MSDIIVEVEQGKLRGKICETSNSFTFFTFKSIPYAKPPVGDLRFSVPVPPESWEGIRDATKDCNICTQLDKATGTIVGDEDCLYLNVYTPKLPIGNAPLLPVMVFVHGGGFIFGHGTDDKAHGPDFLVEKDVIVVSFNYRLGILGYLSLDRKDAPGNMGLRDQVQVLRWIQNNIGKFGGDPKNVTLFGFSAGGASVEYLMLSRTAQGLFHKAVAHSGSSLLPWAHNSSTIKKLAYKIPAIASKTIKDDGELLRYLKEMPSKELISLSMTAINSVQARAGIYFGFVPTVEKKSKWEAFLDEQPYDLLSQGKFNKVPFIAGICSREGLLMAALNKVKLDNLVRQKNFLDLLPFEIPETEKTELNKRLIDIYSDAEQKYNESNSFAVDFFSDVDFFGGAYVATKLISKHNSPVYFYEFAYDGGYNYLKSKYNLTRKGVCHGDETGYLIKVDGLNKNPSETDELVKNRFLEMWTNFAKHGNPTPTMDNETTLKWEPVKDTGLVYLCIGQNLMMKNESELNPARAKLFTELYAKYNKTISQ